MDIKWRFGTTAFIWVLATIMTVVAFNSASAGNLEDWIMVVPLVVAMFATVAIWESAKGSDSSKSETKSVSSGKKADSTAYTMALLMEMMDDDEREEFKYDLKNRILSGEAVTDESLAQELQKRKSKPL